MKTEFCRLKAFLSRTKKMRPDQKNRIRDFARQIKIESYFLSSSSSVEEAIALTRSSSFLARRRSGIV